MDKMLQIAEWSIAASAIVQACVYQGRTSRMSHCACLHCISLELRAGQMSKSDGCCLCSLTTESLFYVVLVYFLMFAIYRVVHK